MATLYRVDGTQEEVKPANGVRFTLTELQGFVGGLIEQARTIAGDLMYCDEEGKLKSKLVNRIATARYRFGYLDPIVGDVVVLTAAEERAQNVPDEDAGASSEAVGEADGGGGE